MNRMADDSLMFDSKDAFGTPRATHSIRFADAQEAGPRFTSAQVARPGRRLRPSSAYVKVQDRRDSATDSIRDPTRQRVSSKRIASVKAKNPYGQEALPAFLFSQQPSSYFFDSAAQDAQRDQMTVKPLMDNSVSA